MKQLHSIESNLPLNIDCRVSTKSLQNSDLKPNLIWTVLHFPFQKQNIEEEKTFFISKGDRESNS